MATACGGQQAPAAGYCSTVQIDPQTQECHEGPTPAGGAYSVGTFLDENRSPVPKDEARWVDIVEYDADGDEIMSTLGTLN